MSDTTPTNRPPRKPRTEKGENPVLSGNAGLTGPDLARPDHATRFQPGQSGNPKGRPKAARNRSALEASLAVRAVLESAAPQLINKAIELAMEGSPTAMRLCLERILPAMQGRAVQLALLGRTAPPDDILAARSALLAAASRGDITPAEAESLSKVIEARRRSWESVELIDRVAELEGRAEDLRTGRKPAVRWVQPNRPPQPESAGENRPSSRDRHQHDQDKQDKDE